MRPDDLAELLQLAQRDEAQPLEGHVVHLEILDVSINGILIVLLEGPRGDPGLEVRRRPGVLIVPLAVGRRERAFRDMGDVVRVPAAQRIPLRLVEDIIGRRHARARVADDARIEPKCSERLYVHDLCLWRPGVDRRHSPTSGCTRGGIIATTRPIVKSWRP